MRRHGDRTSWQFDIVLTNEDKHRLLAFMNYELTMFNELNDYFRKTMAKDKNYLIDLSPELRKAFTASCETQCNINGQLNEKLEPFALQLATMPDKYKLLFEIAAKKRNLHKEMKRRLAGTMIEFYAKQADIKKKFAIIDSTGEESYRSSMAFLEDMDQYRKRHIQLHRKLVSVEYNESENKTSILTPYTKSPLTVEGKNVANINWNYIVIHQQPGKTPTSLTPWQIDVRRTEDPYLLTYQDQNSPFTAVKMANRRERSSF